MKEHGESQGYLLTFNKNNCAGIVNTGFTDVQVTQRVSDKDNSVISQVLLKKLSDGGLLVKELTPGNVIEI
jgi:hypothetical protein